MYKQAGKPLLLIVLAGVVYYGMNHLEPRREKEELR